MVCRVVRFYAVNSVHRLPGLDHERVLPTGAQGVRDRPRVEHGVVLRDPGRHRRLRRLCAHDEADKGVAPTSQALVQSSVVMHAKTTWSRLLLCQGTLAGSSITSSIALGEHREISSCSSLLKLCDTLYLRHQLPLEYSWGHAAPTSHDLKSSFLVPKQPPSYNIHDSHSSLNLFDDLHDLAVTVLGGELQRKCPAALVSVLVH